MARILAVLFLFLLLACSEAATDPGVVALAVSVVTTVAALAWRVYVRSRLGWARDVIALAGDFVRSAVDLALQSFSRGIETASADGVVTREEWEEVRAEACRVFWANISSSQLRRALERARASTPVADLVVGPERWVDGRIRRELGMVLKVAPENVEPVTAPRLPRAVVVTAPET